MKTLRKSFLFLAMFSLVLGKEYSQASVLEECGKAYATAEYDSAYKLCSEAAKDGNVYAQSKLGLMYAYGQWVPKNHSVALKWYQKAADQGDVAAQFNLAILYANVGKSNYYHSGTMVNMEYRIINAVDKNAGHNFKEAVKWYRKAIEQGENATTINYLGQPYVYKNEDIAYEETAEWVRTAANAGFPAAQYLLGYEYENGEVVSKNNIRALKWYLLAARGNDTDGKSSFERLKATMSADDIQEVINAANLFIKHPVDEKAQKKFYAQCGKSFTKAKTIKELTKYITTYEDDDCAEITAAQEKLDKLLASKSGAISGRPNQLSGASAEAAKMQVVLNSKEFKRILAKYKDPSVHVKNYYAQCDSQGDTGAYPVQCYIYCPDYLKAQNVMRYKHFLQGVTKDLTLLFIQKNKYNFMLAAVVGGMPICTYAYSFEFDRIDAW